MSGLAGPEFLQHVERSQLVQPNKLSDVLRGVDVDGATGEELGAKLVDAHLITQWQAGKLGKGLWKDFFLGKYELLEKIGSGGMGVVYRGRHRSLDNKVAIKLLPRQQLRNSVATERFYREARAAAQLNHPNITRTFDVDQAGAFHYLVMEFIDGQTLANMVINHGPLSFVDAANYLQQAASGLAHAHARGLVHRDIKPLNLMLDDHGAVKILDFGLARDLGEQHAGLTSDGELHCLGTADYMAPEQAINSHEVDGRADIYSLGHTMYFLLTGSAPFPTGTKLERIIRHCQSQPPCISAARPDVPAELVAIWKKMTRKQPRGRYQRASDICDDLAAWLNGTPLVHVAIKMRELAIAGRSADGNATLLADPLDGGSSSRMSSVDELPLPPDSLPSIANDPDDLLSMDLSAFEDSADPLNMNTVSNDNTLSSPWATSGLSNSWDTAGSSALGQSASDASLKRARATSNRDQPCQPRQLGDYPLWLCITAGVVLSVSLLVIFFAFANSNRVEVKVETNPLEPEVQIESRVSSPNERPVRLGIRESD